MAGKLNKREYIGIIVDKLDNEGITYSDCLEFFGVNWSVPESTFANYWKEANQIHLERREAINKELQDERINQEKESLKLKILGRNENLEILSKIALSEKERTNDRIKAIETINKMQGFNHPEDINVNGNLTFLDFLRLSSEEDPE